MLRPRTSSVLLVLLLVCSMHAEPSSSASVIKHVVVVMLENRSFDHMLGHLKLRNPNVDGLTGNETNPLDPNIPNSPVYKISFDAPSLIGVDPGHSVEATAKEIWGMNNLVDPAPMDGFVWANEGMREAMMAYNRTVVPSITFLAENYAVFDRFYSSVPGPTQPNRVFLHTGTSHGEAVCPDVWQWVDGDFAPQRTVFQDLADAGYEWGIFYSDFPISLECSQLRAYPEHIHTIFDFYDRAAKGDLPSYSFLEPRWFDFLDWKESDQHPPHSTTYGEYFLADIYDALRASPSWNETLFLITYDEHGGLYDHVPPPEHQVPNPDGLNSRNPPFNFDRLGVRVPFIAVSPWIDSQTIFHEPATSHYDHTSVIGTLRKIFDLPQGPLTKREAWAATFENVVESRSSPRTDCPKHAPRPIPEKGEQSNERWRELSKLQETKANIRRMQEQNPSFATASNPVNGLQKNIAEIAWSLTRDIGSDGKPTWPFDYDQMSVHEASTYVRSQVQRWRQSKTQPL